MSNENSGNSVEPSIEEASKTLERVNFWINNCDTKISFSLAFAGILLGGFFSSSIITGSLNKLINKMLNIDALKEYWEIKLLEVSILVLIAFVVCLICAIIYLFRAKKGTIDPSIYEQSELTTNSILFFGTIANQQFQAFKQKATTVSQADLQNDYLSQVYINSKICQRKFTLYNIGVKYMMFSTGLFVLLNVLFLLIK
ncbi:Pycsar system effector family protein [Metabacillus halosaccharovorans]|uniref:Pycsar system effector family protein n=1 Tax=Metabacillus halosaccharovorans TaxID=930124 RepID=UPI002040FB5D|nr:Pycsar system effector family protein [Metabacillus halosaccharovorans]MCM3444742.1 DUF5706 domain-containing protein [Metabacillus halosaccharovorans]